MTSENKCNEKAAQGVVDTIIEQIVNDVIKRWHQECIDNYETAKKAITEQCTKH